MATVFCPHCTKGSLFYEIGYISHESGFAAVHSEDRVYCINCGRQRYLTEIHDGDEPEVRGDRLPLWVLTAVAPADSIQRAKRIVKASYREDKKTFETTDE